VTTVASDWQGIMSR